MCFAYRAGSRPEFQLKIKTKYNIMTASGRIMPARKQECVTYCLGLDDQKMDISIVDGGALKPNQIVNNLNSLSVLKTFKKMK